MLIGKKIIKCLILLLLEDSVIEWNRIFQNSSLTYMIILSLPLESFQKQPQIDAIEVIYGSVSVSLKTGGKNMLLAFLCSTKCFV